MSYTATPAGDFTNFWNDILVPKFTRFRHVLMDGLSYHSRAAMASLELAPGARALDVGCGWGDTAMQLAQKAGPAGEAVGIDCCDAFLEEGRQDTKQAGITNVKFIVGDAENYAFTPTFDLCFSRFGTMFFANPVAALRNLRRSLKPGGQLMMIVWRALEENPWMYLPKNVVLRFLPPPGEGGQSCGPGPFSMASTNVVTQQLQAAGFVEARFERVDGPVLVGNSPEDAMQFQLALGPAGEIFREAGDLAERRRSEIEEALRQELARYEQDGKIVMASSSWTITARNPA
jgi:ubiquinone/menaquinone biosynthesis C-methylase UbiE